MPLLHFAAYAGNTQLVKILLELGADANVFDSAERTPIFYAIQSASLGVVQQLVCKGAKLDVRDSNGNIPMLVAASIKDSAPLIKYLVSSDQSSIVAVNNDGRNALHELATVASNLSILLPLHLSLISSKPQHEETPLHLATSNGDKDTVLLLLEAGANIEEVDGLGRTALHRSLWSPSISRVLLEHGAKIYATDNHGLQLIVCIISGNIIENTDLLDLFLNRYWRDRKSSNDFPNLDQRLLAIALGKDDARTLDVLLNSRLDPNIQLKSMGQTAVRFTATGDIPYALEKLEALVAYGAALREPSSRDYLILHFLIRNMHLLERIHGTVRP